MSMQKQHSEDSITVSLLFTFNRVYSVCCFFWFLARMDAESPPNVVFLDVADSYTVTWQEGIMCYFKVDPSILPGVRHVVGIFPIDWKLTKECIVCDWSPMPKDYQPDQPLDNCIQFSGECYICVTTNL